METKTWVDIWKKFIQESTRFNILSFYDWLEQHYEVPKEKQNVVNSQQNKSKSGL
jgi:hypothetical protein